jgi:peroxiredoxin
VVALSVDGVADAANMVDLVGAEYPVLADSDTQVAREYGVFDLLGDGVAAPAVFIVDPGGEVVSWYIGQNIADRPSADDIIAGLEQIVS